MKELTLFFKVKTCIENERVNFVLQDESKVSERVNFVPQDENKESERDQERNV